MKLKNTTRQLYALIVDKFDSTAEMQEEEIIQAMKNHGIDFDAAAAERQWWKKKAAGTVARMKDQKGIRNIFAGRDVDGNTIYIHVEKEKNPFPLSQIRTKLEHKRNGIIKSCKKVRRLERAAINQEQMALFTDVKEAQ